MSSDSGIDFASVQVPVGEPEATAPQATPVVNGQAVDINQLDQFNDVDEIDEGASVYEQALPPADGWHQVQLSAVKDGATKEKRYQSDKYQGSVQLTQFADRDGKLQTHFMLVVDYKVNEEGKQGNGQTVREWVSTVPRTINEKSTTPVDSMLQVLTGHAGKGLSRIQKVEKLYQVLATNPGAWGKTQWILEAAEKSAVIDKKTGGVKVKQSGAEKEEYVKFLKGMNQFPEVNGVRQMLEEDPKTGALARTKFRIIDLKPLSAKVS